MHVEKSQKRELKMLTERNMKYNYCFTKSITSQTYTVPKQLGN